MIIYLLLKLFDVLTSFVLSLFPVFETPLWLTNNLPEIITKIVSFNYYLPILETITVVIFLIATTFTYKVFKIVLVKVGIDLNA